MLTYISCTKSCNCNCKRWTPTVGLDGTYFYEEMWYQMSNTLLGNYLCLEDTYFNFHNAKSYKIFLEQVNSPQKWEDCMVNVYITNIIKYPWKYISLRDINNFMLCLAFHLDCLHEKTPKNWSFTNMLRHEISLAERQIVSPLFRERCLEG